MDPVRPSNLQRALLCSRSPLASIKNTDDFPLLAKRAPCAPGIAREFVIRLLTRFPRGTFVNLRKFAGYSCRWTERFSQKFRSRIPYRAITNGGEKTSYRGLDYYGLFSFYFGTLMVQLFSTYGTDFYTDARGNFLLARQSNGGPTRGEKIPFVFLLLLWRVRRIFAFTRRFGFTKNLSI